MKGSEVLMERGALSDIIRDQTQRAFWEVNNVIDCIPDSCWDKQYYNAPVWKHVYHMLHSLDQWFINPKDTGFKEPAIHETGLNNLDVVSGKKLTRAEIADYFSSIKQKINNYLQTLRDDDLHDKPGNCAYTKFTLILAQHRHLHTHMGILMGFIINDTGRWPKVLGLEGCFPQGDYIKYE